MKILKPVLVIVAAAFVAIQFIRPPRNGAEGDASVAFNAAFEVPPDIRQMLETACYDCHSNNTRYPWYSEIQPVAWWLSDHITEGKKHLNFSEFANYRLRRQHHKFEEIVEMVNAGEMPLPSYTLAHWDAKLSTEQKEKLAGWADAMRILLEQRYPDSLNVQ